MSRDRFTASRYHKLPLHMKQRNALGVARALELVRCPRCSTQFMLAELAIHDIERCAGSRAARDAQLLLAAQEQHQQRDRRYGAVACGSQQSCASGPLSASGEGERKCST